MKTNKNVLLVEDDNDDQMFFTDALTKCADTHLIHIANNGKEALEWLNSSSTMPDIIFTDVNMPLMNGIEFYEKFLKIPAFCKIPVIFLSSDTRKIDYISKLGVKTFIKKGTAEKSLLKQIDKVIKMEVLISSFKRNKKKQVSEGYTVTLPEEIVNLNFFPSI